MREFKTIFLKKTRMTTFIKTKFKKSDDQTNIYKYRVAAILQNIKINFPKFMEKRQLFHVKNVCVAI